MKRTLIPTLLLGLTLAAAEPAVTAAKKMIADGKYDDAISNLEKAKQGKPNSTEIKQALADAHFANGEYYLNNQQLPPMRKYPSALKEYRAVLQYDKANKPAQERIGMIEGIYKSMGRPVPQ